MSKAGYLPDENISVDYVLDQICHIITKCDEELKGPNRDKYLTIAIHYGAIKQVIEGYFDGRMQ